MDPITIGLGVASLGGQLFGAMKGGQANNANDALLAQRKEENDAFFKSRINRDFLQTNAAKGVLEKIRQQYQNQDKTIESKAAVNGSTPEQVIAEKSANNQDLNNATNSLAQGATNYQENAENQYQQSQNAMLGAEMNINNQKAANAGNLASNAGNLLGTAAMLQGFGGEGGAGDIGTALGRSQSQTDSPNSIAGSSNPLIGLKNSLINKFSRKPLG